MSTISTLPPAPGPTDDTATFNTRAFALVAALATFVTEVNALAAGTNADAGTATTQAGTATAQAVAAAASAAAALSSALAAAASAGASIWVSGTTYAIGDVRWSPVTRLTYRRITAGAGTTDPSLDTTNWAALSARPALVRLALRNQGVI